MSRRTAYALAALSIIGVLVIAACTQAPRQFDRKCATVAAPYIVATDDVCSGGSATHQWFYADVAGLDDDDSAVVGQPIDDDWLGQDDDSSGFGIFKSKKTTTVKSTPKSTPKSTSKSKPTTKRT